MAHIPAARLYPNEEVEEWGYAVLRIHLFGKLRVQFEERDLAGLDARKVQELFAYLLLYRDRPHPREFLSGLFWGDCPIAQSKTYLRSALWKLQTALCPKARSTCRLLQVDPEWVQLHASADFWLDVAVFEQEFAAVRGVSGADLAVHDAQRLREVVSLYRGDLLEGWYDEWCLYERERLQQMYLALLDKLMSYAEAHHEYEAGLECGMRILRFDRARECTHRRMMALHHLAGDRTGALHQYDRCVAALAEELGVQPDDDTRSLCEHIRASHRELAPGTLPRVTSALATGCPSLLDVLGRLQQFQAQLLSMYQDIQQDIRTVEALIQHSA